MCRSNADTLCSARQLAEQFTGLPDNVGRFHIINALKAVGSDFGFTQSHIKYLELMVSFTRETDWHIGGDAFPVVWLSVQEIAKKLGITTRQVNRIEKNLVELGAIYQKDYGNYRRFGCRDEQGGVRFGYGVDLRPLALFWDRLADRLEQSKEQDQIWKETRFEVSSLRRRIGDILRSGNQAIAELADAMASDGALVCRLNRVTPFEVLKTIRDKLQQLLQKLEKIIVDNVAFEVPLQAKMSDECDTNVRHHIIPTKIPNVVSELPQYTQTVSESAPLSKGRGCVLLAHKERQTKKSSKRGRGSPPPLGAIMDASSPRLRGLLLDPDNPDPKQVEAPTTDALIAACKRLAPMLGVSASLWREAMGHLNPYGASLALLVIDARHYAGEVQSPGGMFRGMLEKDREGDLNINASLHGLVDRAMKEDVQ